MSWQLLILLHAGLAAGAALQKRRLMVHPEAGAAPLAVNAISLLAVYACGLTLALIQGGIQLGLEPGYWWTLLAGGVLFAASGICSLASFTYLESSVATIISACNTLFAIALAWLFLGERLTFTELIGLAVLMAAVVYLMSLGRVRQRSSARQRSHLKGILLGLGASAMFGLGLVIEKQAVASAAASTYLVFGWGIQVVLALAVIGLRPHQLRVLRNRQLVRAAAAAGVTAGLAGACFILAQAASDNLSLISTLSNMRIVMVALLAAWLLRERDHFKQRVVAAGVAVIGVSLTLW